MTKRGAWVHSILIALIEGERQGMGGTDTHQPGRLILAVPVRIHEVPQGAGVNSRTLGGLDPHRSVQRRLDLDLEGWSHVPLAPRGLDQVAVGHP